MDFTELLLGLFFVKDLEDTISYRFSKRSYLRLALTHRSCNKNSRQNERLEFLGDAVLGLVTALGLYKKFPYVDEGFLTALRSTYVCKGNLEAAAKRLQLDSFVYTALSIRGSSTIKRSSILPDVIEALIGAAFLDKGLPGAQELISELLGPLPDTPHLSTRNAKSELQELVQCKDLVAPRYEVSCKQGVDHAPKYFMRIFINDSEIAVGFGFSKKEASTNAAKLAIVKIFNQ